MLVRRADLPCSIHDKAVPSPHGSHRPNKARDLRDLLDVILQNLMEFLTYRAYWEAARDVRSTSQTVKVRGPAGLSLAPTITTNNNPAKDGGRSRGSPLVFDVGTRSNTLLRCANPSCRESCGQWRGLSLSDTVERAGRVGPCRIACSVMLSISKYPGADRWN